MFTCFRYFLYFRNQVDNCFSSQQGLWYYSKSIWFHGLQDCFHVLWISQLAVFIRWKLTTLCRSIILQKLLLGFLEGEGNINVFRGMLRNSLQNLLSNSALDHTLAICIVFFLSPGISLSPPPFKQWVSSVPLASGRICDRPISFSSLPLQNPKPY